MFHQIYHHDPLQIYQVKKIELFYDTKTERIKIVKVSHVVLFQVDSEEIHDKIRYTIRSSIQISNKEKSLPINLGLSNLGQANSYTDLFPFSFTKIDTGVSLCPGNKRDRHQVCAIKDGVLASDRRPFDVRKVLVEKRIVP